MNINKKSSYKLLFLLNLLLNGEYTKNEIIDEFNKNDIQISKALINSYIEKYLKYGIEIKSRINKKREKAYYFEKKEANIKFSNIEMKVISDIKKLLFAQKNYNYIRKTMRLFYKISNFIKDKEQQRDFLDFGYYSTINWYIVRELEKHCNEKNLIEIEYILPQKECKVIKLQADSIRINEWSQRLYLHCVFEESRHFSILPIDRIFMIKRVLKKSEKQELISQNLTYIVSKNVYKNMPQDEKEKIIKDENDKLTIERVADDTFYLAQRLLSFCPDVYYISEGKIKALVKEKLENLKAIYEKGYN